MNGIIYLASGSTYIKQAERSAESLKQHNPSLTTAVFSDEPIHSNKFDEVIRLEKPIRNMGDSILTDEHILFDRNLYLDTDTYVAGDITDLFELLDEFEFGVAENPGAGCWNKNIYQNMDIDLPDSFPEFNSGVMVYKNCEAVRELFASWNNLYDEIDTNMVPYETNQPALRAALYNGSIKYNTLRNEYNFQMNHHRYARGKIKIFHNSGDSDVDPSLFSKVANSYEGDRVITFDDYPCRVIPTNQKSIKYKIKRFSKDPTYRRVIKNRIENIYYHDGIWSRLREFL